MTSDLERHRRLAEHVLSTWNTQDVERVLDCYADDLVYLDPNTRGPVVGRDAMRAYLTKLFARWTQHWEPQELFPLEGTDGVAIRWAGSLAQAGESRSLDIAGLDLVILEGDLIVRNEVYFDRSPLAALMTTATA
ncbi:MAG: nuclear transport factor 2 family protein [Actinobacteria bacterium]|nr:MAG: nuclear transport factor 2 family protein [Actinomycetota bacterium]